MRHQGVLDVAEAVTVVAVPLISELDAVGPGDLLLPAQLGESVAVDVVAQVVEHAVLHEGDHVVLFARLIPREADKVTGDLDVLDLVCASHVVYESYLALEEDLLESAGHVLHEEEVALVLAGTVQGHLAATHQKVDELGYKLLRELMGPVDVVASGDDDRHLKGAMVGLGQELSPGLGRSVRVRRLQHLHIQPIIKC